jgi:ribosomal protein S18 acetylase RimI-like enzyme
MKNAEARFVNLSASNLADEHICCAIAGKQHQEGVDLKKAFLARGLERGLVFRKLDVRGKVFIEYAPADSAWRPVSAPGYLVIHCLWVSGRYKAQGIGRDLLRYCLEEGSEHRGVVVVAGRKPYLTDTRFYQHHGFEVVDRTESGFDLLCHRSEDGAPAPRFTPNAKRSAVPEDSGVHFEYAYQCPFVPGCLRDMSEVAREIGLSVTTRELASAKEAQSAASPFGTFGAFLYGKLVTHELTSPKKFRKMLEKALADCR